METVSTILDVAGWFLMGVATVIAAEALRSLSGWRDSVAVETLKRRLADVEALRRGEAVNLAEHPDHAAIRYLEELRLGEGDSVTILCDDPEAESTAMRMAIVCNGAWTQWEDRRFYGESIVQCLAKGVGAMRITPVDRTLTTPVPSMIREHIGADPREWDRAYAEAGIMPVSEYVRRHSTTRPVHGGYPG